MELFENCTVGKVRMRNRIIRSATHDGLADPVTEGITDELIRKYVEENYRKAITLGETARKFYLSAGRFSHFFKREVGISFMNYVNLYRVMKAEEMLKETELPVSEIAFLNGFGSISQFNRVFRSATGRKPRDVRSP